MKCFQIVIGILLLSKVLCFLPVPSRRLHLHNVLMGANTDPQRAVSFSIPNDVKKARTFIASALMGFSVVMGPVPFPSLLTHTGSSTVAVAVDKDFSVAKYPLFEEVWDSLSENYFDDTYNGQDWGKLKKETLSKLDSGGDEHAVLKKLLASLGDKYTRLVDKKAFEALFKYDAIGVGLLFQSDPGLPLRVSGPPTAGSSSEKVGMKKGDLILTLNGKSTETMTAMSVLDMMSNDESSTITLEYVRPATNNGDGGAALDTYEKAAKAPGKKSVTLKRSSIEKATNPITYSTQRIASAAAGGEEKLAGYIKFADFNAEAVPHLRDAIEALENQGVDEYLLDLRGNTGGGFQFALNVGGMFLPTDSPMVTAKGKAGDSTLFKTSYPEGVLTKKPLVILTDGLSASASEVLTGGLRDNCRAVTAGSTTFGKGKIQAVFGLANGEGLVMTVAQYVTPKGSVIQSRGIAPDLDSAPGLSNTNPYLNLVMSQAGVAGAPDLSTIDFMRAAELVSACKPPAAGEK
jgi:carboxyl-terminal processing protease